MNPHHATQPSLPSVLRRLVLLGWCAALSSGLAACGGGSHGADNAGAFTATASAAAASAPAAPAPASPASGANASTPSTTTVTGTAAADWNGLTTFELVNATGGKWSDAQVYWAIIGRDWATGQFVHVDRSGRLVPMTLADNGALSKNGVAYSNYFQSLAQARSVTIPALDSARVLMSVGSPMFIKVVTDGKGQIGYAGANIENPSDPNIDVFFDFGEMAIVPKGRASQGLFINTTRVDHFGFPLRLRVQGLGGYDRSVGEPLTESREALFNRFVAEVPAEFKGLAQAPYAPYRIVAPAHAGFQPGKAQASYLQPYIDAVWARYRNQDLVFKLDNLGTFTGRVSGDVFRFTGGKQAGTFYVNGKPDTAMVMLGNGLLNDARGASDVGTQLQIQAQLCAALNRGVVETPDSWYLAAAHYPAGALVNHYARFWHVHNLEQLSYGFAYDDVGNHSASLHTPTPTTVTFSIGWGAESAPVPAAAATPTTPTAPTGWTLAWSDEFNGTALDPAVWSHDTGAGGWGNNESQYYQARNAVVKDGFLTITAQREAVGGAAYTSARIQTARKKTFTYGRLEMRARLPRGQGLWPAFWMLGANCSSFGLYGGNTSWPRCGEIDIMEMVGGLADGSGDFTTHGTLHYLNTAGVNPMAGFSYRSPTRLSDDFRVYAVEWTPQGFTWTIDGVAFGSKSMTADMTAFEQPFFLLLNLAVGGNWGGWPDATTVFPQTFVIDYLRHYTRP